MCHCRAKAFRIGDARVGRERLDEVADTRQIVAARAVERVPGLADLEQDVDEGAAFEGGGVLTAIGGRMPNDVVFDLHQACGYEPELIAFDVKLQDEPQLVIPGYSRAEADSGVVFTFYTAEAVDVVAEARRTGLDGAQLADAVADRLREFAISAAEAERRSRRGERVAHSVLMVCGRRLADRTLP